MSGRFEEISGGHEPDRAPLLPSRPLLPLPRWSPSRWVGRHHLAATALAVTAVLVLGIGNWAWNRAHTPAAVDALHVRLDPSEYLLAGRFDGQGRADVLLLVRVDVATGFTAPVLFLRLEGGGLTSESPHAIDGSPTQFAIPAQVSCDQWTDGKGVRAVFEVGPGPAQPGPGREVDIPLDSGRNSPVHAQISAPCVAFAATHPLRLTVFSVSLEPKDPAAQTTWTLVNRSSDPVTLDPSQDLQVFGNGAIRPLEPIVTGDLQPVVIAPHATVSVVRIVGVTSCLTPIDLDPTGETLRLIGSTTAVSGPPDGQAVVDLPFAFVRQVFSVALDTCKGAPDLSGASATLNLSPGPPGKGRAELSVRGPITLPAPWTARVVSTADLHVARDVVSGQDVQRLQGPGPLLLTVGWVVGTCRDTDPSLIGIPLDVTITVSAIRKYPYVLPVTLQGHTSCTPGTVQH